MDDDLPHPDMKRRQMSHFTQALYLFALYGGMIREALLPPTTIAWHPEKYDYEDETL